MTIPQWKCWVSYLIELPIEAAETDVNPDLQLSLRRGRFCLSTPHAIYSYGDLYDNFSKTFDRINLAERPISNVLILGFGLGSIPYMLEKKYGQQYHYTGVEADEVIVHWASKYVLSELDSPVEVHLGDAAIYVEMCERKFDLIVMDVFLDNVIPSKFEEVDFLENLKHLLSPKGILLYNRLTFKDMHKKNTLDFFENKFKAVFPSAKYFDLGHNWMLYTGTPPLILHD